ncbi:MAG: hypothetical protein LIP23_01925 [Planctomycetes bacterium]|nr:hypothetical protein [Planctomycetota bacterium]
MEFVSAYGAELHDVKEFARRLDVDVATVRLWEEGAREPLEVELTAIAYITSTTVRYLQRPLQYASLSFEEWQNLESVTTEHGEITMSFEPITGRIIRREFSVPMVYHPETVKIVFE